MPARSFSPMLKRRTAPAAAAPATRTPPRAAAPAAGVPRFAATPETRSRHAPPRLTAVRPAAAIPRPVLRRQASWESEAHDLAAQVTGSQTAAENDVAHRRLRRLPGLGPSPPPAEGSSSSPLPASLRDRLEAATGFDLGDVVLRRGPGVDRLVEDYSAVAITTGGVIFLHSTVSSADTGVLAHEVAHVIQQRGPGEGSARDEERMFTAADPRSAQPLSLSDIGGALRSAGRWVGRQAKRGFWWAVRQISPQLETALRNLGSGGLWGLLTSWLQRGVDLLLAPVRGVLGFLSSAVEGVREFGTLLFDTLALLPELVQRGSRTLLRGLRRLGRTLRRMTGGIWSRLLSVLGAFGRALAWIAGKVGQAFDFIFDLLGSAARAVWNAIKWLAGKIAWVFDRVAGWVWRQIRDLLGFEGGSGDGGGVMAWFQRKIQAAVDFVESIVSSVAGTVRWLADLGPLQVLADLIGQALALGDALAGAAEASESPDGPAENQDLLRDVVLPAIQRGIAGLRGGLQAGSAGVQSIVTGFADGFAAVIRAVGRIPVLNLIDGVFTALGDRVSELGALAAGAVQRVFGLVDTGLELVATWVEPFLATLVQLASVVFNAAVHLPGLVFGTFWRLIPAWIRNPIRDFIIDHVLKRIPLLGTLITRLPDLWQRAGAIFRRFVSRVFREGDLVGAAWGFFTDLIALAGIPTRMIAEIIRHALRTIGAILRHPFAFLINLVGAIGRGLGRFIERLWDHLRDSLADWIFGQLKTSRIVLPREFSLPGLFSVVVQVLRLTTDHVVEAIRRRLGDRAAQAVRLALAAGSTAVGWIRILAEKGPAGLWTELQAHLGNLWDLVIGRMRAFVLERIIAEGTRWLLTLLDVTGIMPAIKTGIAIYHAIESFVENARRIFDLIHSGFTAIAEIAAGNLQRAADLIENACRNLLTVAIGFLANQVGLGRLADRIMEVIEQVRGVVLNALEKLIGATLSGVDWAVAKGRAAASALRTWWKARKTFSVEGAEHAVYLDGGEAGAKLMVASTPSTFAAYISGLKVDPQKAGAHATALQLAQRIDRAVQAAAKDKAARGQSPVDHAGIIDALLGELSEVTRTLMTRSAWGRSSPTVYGPIVNTFGSSASIERLTPDHDAGSPASKAPGNAHWEILRLRRSATGGSSYYVRGHLLNDNLGGPAEWMNLTPITQETNNRSAASMLHRFESVVKRAVREERKAVSFSVTANYGRPARTADIGKARTRFPPKKADVVASIMAAERLIPVSLDCTAHALKADGSHAGSPVAVYRAENVIDTDPDSYRVA